MGAMVGSVQSLTATGKYLVARAGESGGGGWIVQVTGTFSASMTLKNPTSAPGAASVTLGSALKAYDLTTGVGSSAAITTASAVTVRDRGQDLYLDLTWTSGTVVVTVMVAGASPEAAWFRG